MPKKQTVKPLRLRITCGVEFTVNVTDKQLATAGRRLLKDQGGNDYDLELIKQLLPAGFTLVEENDTDIQVETGKDK